MKKYIPLGKILFTEIFRYALLITLFCATMLAFGGPGMKYIVLITKVITWVAILGYFFAFRKDYFYALWNTNISIRKLIALLVVIDMFLFFCLTALLNVFF